MSKIRVLVIDDSLMVRKILTNTLEKDNNITVVGTARDPYEAVSKITCLKPDVLTLDVEMPRMNGLEFLKKLMSSHPMPVIMVSTLTTRGSEITLKALNEGAVDFVAKPCIFGNKERQIFQQEIINKVKVAARVDVRKLTSFRYRTSTVSKKVNKLRYSNLLSRYIIGIGASTGGVKAIKYILPGFPRESPGIVIVQHMPGGFTNSFARLLNNISTLDVREAATGDIVKPGTAFVAPGGYHLEVLKKGHNFYIRLNKNKKIHHQRPAVDVTFKSMAECAGKNAIGVLLTGMGQDGARGLKKIRQAGGYTLAQDRETATIFGMPRKAIEIGAVDEEVSTGEIVDKIFLKLNNNHR
ncbi:protein-glutamate methylesterase/protein-glutamine glutaminase [Halothermothrix orenii]|uniref:Protein-glutamate methylesterase/protein-glutamine glutaminase n=1 Tax=Halothermothrix orenii (strain H 168 / OCM 544 / DSM 9562) TaxID=373903 RepID=B8D0R6_HALOH|nr:chemotaxis response regulator protein-glutamate methylesterase [Halothermothrix orenii]ACL71002.1 response regulator receiver modulated CheB methylesterase [Halothermothrix orenii H 168]